MAGVGNYGTELLGGRYRLVERLGAGGMSVVWRGFDEVLGRQVAVKVLASRLASDRAFRHRLRMEAQAAARLVHPNITNVYDYGESVEGGLTVPYVVMELVDGGSLAARLGRDRQLPWREAAGTVAEVAAALAAAHARGVVHRDVTPGNVMLTGSGVKVVDFGISALVGESEAGPDGQIFGTPAYLAPERLDEGQVSAATDVYAVGLLLYRTLTGRLPWQASTTTEMLRAHLYADPAPMPPVEGLPEQVVALCSRCLAKAPEDRPSSAEVAGTLAAVAGRPVALPVSSQPSGVTGPDHESAELAAAGTTILPWSTTTGALWSAAPTREPGTVRRNPLVRNPVGRRRIRVAVAGVGLLALTGAIWAAAASTSSGGGGAPVRAAAGTAEPKPPTCQAGYALRTDSGRAFDAELTVKNTGDQPVRDWQLAFAFPADQAITGTEPAQWQQQGRDVLLRPADGAADLGPGASVAVRITGTYAGANPLPVRFQLGESVCDVQVSGVAGTSAPAGGSSAGAAATVPASGGGNPVAPQPHQVAPQPPGPAVKGKDNPKPEPKKPPTRHTGDDEEEDEDEGDEDE
ncbi:serine/threonine-protein kinase [Micromonospora sp. NBC_01796]|uniref:serine/threonine-protein kinase n=1 Tax=Micromonospora sp. NBC_01796 TaxID=2975987 RepID=UPI002DDBAEA7|nr:serine/threonine-protein kinase [Micromonospora sp. NBC_01796]WSA83787.1 protein kinase [Micromonospora sp. NBC_01796]